MRNLTAEDSEYNAITFGCLFEFIREKGSKQRGARHGDRLRSNSIIGIISTLNAHFSCFAGAPLLNIGANTTSKQAAKQARAEDGPPGSRAVAASLRAPNTSAPPSPRAALTAPPPPVSPGQPAYSY